MHRVVEITHNSHSLVSSNAGGNEEEEAYGQDNHLNQNLSESRSNAMDLEAEEEHTSWWQGDLLYGLGCSKLVSFAGSLISISTLGALLVENCC